MGSQSMELGISNQFNKSGFFSVFSVKSKFIHWLMYYISTKLLF